MKQHYFASFNIRHFESSNEVISYGHLITLIDPANVLDHFNTLQEYICVTYSCTKNQIQFTAFNPL